MLEHELSGQTCHPSVSAEFVFVKTCTQTSIDLQPFVPHQIQTQTLNFVIFQNGDAQICDSFGENKKIDYLSINISILFPCDDERVGKGEGCDEVKSRSFMGT